MRSFKKTRVASTGLRLAAVAGLAAMVGACAGMELEGVQDLEPQGSEFHAGLYAGYVELATNEHGEYDFRDSDHFAMKAAGAARGEDVAPTDLSERMRPGQGARRRIQRPNQLRMLVAGAGRGAPGGRHQRLP